MKTLLRILLVLLLILCIAGVTAIIKYPFFNPVYRHKYSDEKYEILIENLKNKGAISTSERKSEIVTNFSEIYPYWLGTRWNFNGISQVPGEGSIACGYFVTTVIRDMNFDIDRIKLAQCASEKMIIELIDEKKIKRYNGKENELMLKYLEDQKTNLFIVGLDNHTGFILNDGNELYFIHSSGRFPFCVIKEKAKNSKTLLESKYKVLGCISESTKIWTYQKL